MKADNLVHSIPAAEYHAEAQIIPMQAYGRNQIRISIQDCKLHIAPMPVNPWLFDVPKEILLDI
jgi:hypothetical protein